MTLAQFLWIAIFAIGIIIALHKLSIYMDTSGRAAEIRRYETRKQALLAAKSNPLCDHALADRGIAQCDLNIRQFKCTHVMTTDTCVLCGYISKGFPCD
jgi:hypothetical protein